MNTLKEIYNYREMVFSLVRKDLRGRYKGSVLGFMWTFINPLFQLIIYNLVFSTILKSDIEKYYLFLFVALIPWIFFSAALTGGSTSVLSQKDMVKKIYFPREVLPIAYVTSCFVNMLYCFIVVFLVVLISGVKLSFVALLYLPIIMAIEYILCLGIAFISSAVTVFLRDLEHILGIVAMAWMYLTPVMYSIEIVPEKYQRIFSFNPMTPIIRGYRDILYYGQVPHIRTFISATILGTCVLIVGYFVFGLMKKRFVEEM